MSDLPRAARSYIGALVVLAVSLTGFMLWHGPALTSANAALMAVLIVALVISHQYPLPFAEHATLTLDTAVIMTACIMLPQGFAATVALIGPLLALRRQGAFHISEAVFNAAQSALQSCGIALVFWLTGYYNAPNPEDAPLFMLVVLIAGLVAFVINTVAVSFMIAVQEDEPPVKVWKQAALQLSRTEQAAHVGQIGLAILASALFKHEPWTVVFLFLPAATVHSALSTNVRMRLRAEQELVHQAFHDPLTDLPNRAYFMEKLGDALERAGDAEGSIAVLFLDLDRFKLINDTLGHGAGDELLVEVARRLKGNVRSGDLVARLGGDEFTVLLEGLNDTNEATRIAHRIEESCRAPMLIGGREMRVTTSVGVLIRAAHHHSPVDLLRDADVALYQAKDAGRARVAIFVPEQSAAVKVRVSLGDDLASALDRGEIDVRYEPILDLAGGSVLGFEARPVWHHPTAGPITPPQLHEVADDTGLTSALARRIAGIALADAAAWGTPARQPALHLDLWPALLADEVAREELALEIRRSLIDPGRIVLELAESVLTTPSAPQAIDLFGAAGVGLLIDHVGTGPADVARLAVLPVTGLKLDRRITQAIGAERGATAVARAVQSFCRDLELRMFAEGIDSTAAQSHCTALGIIGGQGAAWTAPLPADAIAAWTPAVHLPKVEPTPIV